MSDLKLFRLEPAGVSELAGGAVALEKSLQAVFENHLEELLGVRFLASEFSTNEGGRMDTLGIDENGSPVIIEYKRATNENVINQGLFYLEWLMRHRKDFEWLVLNSFGMDVAKSVDWNGPRLICIANDFTKYDELAVKRMDSNIALIRYRRFEGDLLLLEQLTSTTGSKTAVVPSAAGVPTKGKYKTITDYLAAAPPDLLDRFHLVTDYLKAMGDDVQTKILDNYIAFRRIKNFACVELRNQLNKVLVYVKVDPTSIELENGFTRDMRNTGHYGTGDLEISIHSDDDFEKAKSLMERSYHEA